MGKYEEYGLAADTEISDLEKTEAVLRETISAQQESLDNQATKISQLEKALADCQNGSPIPPLPTTSLIGSSTGQPIPGYKETDLSVIRVYLQPGDQPKSWDADSQVKQAAQNCIIGAWVSGKDAPDTWLDSFFASWQATGKHLTYTQNHEFGNDGPATGTTPAKFPTTAQIAEYKRRWEYVKTIAKKYPYVTIVDIQLGNQSPTEWEKLYIPGLNGSGFDRYNPGIGAPKKYTPVAEVFGPIVAFAKLKNLPLYVGETGTGVVGTDTAGRVKWTAEARKYLTDNKVAVACWWNQALVVMDAATAKAWLG